MLASLTLALLAPATPDLLFAERRIQTSEDFVDVLTGDWNEDGYDDVLAASDVGRVYLYLSTATTEHGVEQIIFLGNSLDTAVADDFNGDGHLDLAATIPSQGAVAVLAGNGDGSFLGPALYEAGTTPTDLAVGDVDNDGLLDLVVIDEAAAEFVILLGRQTGFLPPYSVDVDAVPEALAVADLELDGDQDILFITDDAEDLRVSLGLGDGSFLAPDSFLPLESNLLALGVAEVTGDAFPDAVVGGLTKVVVYAGRGDGSFENGVEVQSALSLSFNRVSDFGFDDFDRDGVLDLVIGDLGIDPRINIYRGGDPTNFEFLGRVQFGKQDSVSPALLATGDFDADGFVDAAMVANKQGRVYTLRGSKDSLLGTPSSGPLTARIQAVDLDGEGAEELIDLPAGAAGLTLRVYSMDDGGTYAESFNTDLQGFASNFTHADFNSDGDNDILLSTNQAGPDHLVYLAGDGDGTLRPGVTVGEMPTPAEDLEVGDIDNDGIFDAVFSSQDPDFIVVGFGEGSWALGDLGAIQGSQGARRIELGDFDGDGNLDVVSTRDEPELFVQLGTGVAGLDAFTQQSISIDLPTSSVRPLKVGDIDLDGELDLLAGSFNELVVVRGSAGANFEEPEVYDHEIPGQPGGISIGDLDGDGWPEVVAHDTFFLEVISVFAGGESGLGEALVTFTAQAVDADSVALTDTDGDGILDIVQSGTFVHRNLALPAPSFTAKPKAVSVAAGGTQSFELCAGVDFAGGFYVILGTTGGTTPGIPLAGVVLPLNFSPYLISTLSSGAYLVDQLGTLDSAGVATASNEIPTGLPPSVVGATVHHAYLVLDLGPPTVAVFASDPVALDLLP